MALDHPLPLRALAHEAGLTTTAGVDAAELPALMRRLDEVALLAMRHTLHAEGVFRAGVAHTSDDVADLIGVAERHRWILRRWLAVLTDEDMLHHNLATGRYHDLRPVDRSALAAARRDLDTARRGLGYPPAMTRFFLTAIHYLPELLRDEVPLQALLFPDGDITTAEAAYKDNIINAYLNAATNEVLRHTVDRHANRGPLRILELGAGVGGTTTDLLDALTDQPIAYLYTDVSRYFLDTARQRFRSYPFLSYARFDINSDLTTQGVPPASQHLIIAANVAHNAHHVGRFLAGVRNLIAPGGTLVLIESCREHYQVMTSMHFLMSPPPGGRPPGHTDLRSGTDRIFLTRPQWLHELHGARLTPNIDLPDPDHPLAALAQHVFVATR